MRSWLPVLVLAGCNIYFVDRDQPPPSAPTPSPPDALPRPVDARPDVPPVPADAAPDAPPPAVDAVVVIRPDADTCLTPSSDEAPFELDRIAYGATLYFRVHGEYPPESGSVNPGAYGGACSLVGGKFATIDWSNLAGWTELSFSIGIPNHYSYVYTRTGATTARAQAVGDLDCDGVYATYQLNLDTTQAPQIIEPPPNVR